MLGLCWKLLCDSPRFIQEGFAKATATALKVDRDQACLVNIRGEDVVSEMCTSTIAILNCQPVYFVQLEWQQVTSGQFLLSKPVE